jgi:hypothetical protein
MLIVKFTQTYQHTARRTWQAGDTPTLDRELAVSLRDQGIVEILGAGCGCPAVDLDVLSADNMLAMRGITNEELEAGDLSPAEEE